MVDNDLLWVEENGLTLIVDNSVGKSKEDSAKNATMLKSK